MASVPNCTLFFPKHLPRTSDSCASCGKHIDKSKGYVEADAHYHFGCYERDQPNEPSQR